MHPVSPDPLIMRGKRKSAVDANWSVKLLKRRDASMSLFAWRCIIMEVFGAVGEWLL